MNLTALVELSAILTKCAIFVGDVGQDQQSEYDAADLFIEAKNALIQEIQRRLGPDYDVILEAEGMANEHGHAEWDKKDPNIRKV